MPLMYSYPLFKRQSLAGSKAGMWFPDKKRGLTSDVISRQGLYRFTTFFVQELVFRTCWLRRFTYHFCHTGEQYGS